VKRSVSFLGPGNDGTLAEVEYGLRKRTSRGALGWDEEDMNAVLGCGDDVGDELCWLAST
jgi:hypothetical protein